MKKIILAILFSASFSLSASAADLNQVALVLQTVTKQVTEANGVESKILEVVSKAVKSNPELASQIVKAAIEASGGADCSAELVAAITKSAVNAAPSMSGEIVKAAIDASDASAELVASIVETAAILAPAQINEIYQVATAEAPGALEKVNAVVKNLVSATGNPLNFPAVTITVMLSAGESATGGGTSTTITLTPSGLATTPLVMPIDAEITSEIVDPSDVTEVNP